MKTQAKREKEEITLWNFCQKAASKLDKEVPGWFRKIDLNKFDITNSSFCILGQLKGKGPWTSLFKELRRKYSDALGYEFFVPNPNYTIVYPKKIEERMEEQGFLCSKDTVERYWEKLIIIRRNKEEK